MLRIRQSERVRGRFATSQGFALNAPVLKNLLLARTQRSIYTASHLPLGASASACVRQQSNGVDYNIYDEKGSVHRESSERVAKGRDLAECRAARTHHIRLSSASMTAS